MPTIMRCSALTWNTVHQMILLTPSDIIEITAMVGKEVEELAQYLQDRFPGILQELATRYLDTVLATMPEGILPARREVDAFVEESRNACMDARDIRELATALFEDRVNVDSPAWAKYSMIAMIQFGIGDFASTCRQAGIARNELLNPHFEEILYGDDRDRAKKELLITEQEKAVVLIQIINERRIAA